VLLPDTTAEGAVPLAERIRGTISAITVPGVERSITVSIGIADLIQHGGDAPGLLRQADRALYTAKALGRNRVVVAPVADGPRPTSPAADPDRPPAAGMARSTEPTEPTEPDRPDRPDQAGGPGQAGRADRPDQADGPDQAGRAAEPDRDPAPARP